MRAFHYNRCRNSASYSSSNHHHTKSSQQMSTYQFEELSFIHGIIYLRRMKNNQQIGFGSSCIHGGFEMEQHHSHLTPIYASSTYLFDSADHAVDLFTGKVKGFIYGRFGNPTIEQTENKIAGLEAHGLQDDEGNPLQ